MELHRIIEKLRKERAKLDDIISSLEQLHRVKLQAKKIVPKKRGRKFMDAEARLEVSVRMKKYWAARRMRLKESGQAPPGQSGQVRAIQ